MNVQITETSERKSLSIRNNGIEWTQDLLGNAGALSDGQLVWSEEDDAYLCDQGTYDWWAQYIADTEATEAEAQALADELGIPVADVTDHIGTYQYGDYEMHRAQAVQAMSDLREQYS